MNRMGGINSFGSVEDLIRTSLGGSFIDQTPTRKEEKVESDTEISGEEEIEEIINSSIQRLKNFDPSAYKKKPTSFHREEPENLRDTYREEKIEREEVKIPKKQETVSSKISNYYPFYRDIEEVFECKVTIEGTASNSIVRLLLETETWDVIFQGKIKKDGICSIPIKKLSLFPIGTIGKATLEVIVDDILFTPWENPFRIEESKKVEVEVFKRRPK